MRKIGIIALLAFVTVSLTATLQAHASCYISEAATLSFDDKDRRDDVQVLLNWSEQEHYGQLVVRRISTGEYGIAGISCDQDDCSLDDDGNGANQTKLVFDSSVGDGVSLEMNHGEIFASRYDSFDSVKDAPGDVARYVAVGRSRESHNVGMVRTNEAQCARYSALYNDSPDAISVDTDNGTGEARSERGH